jgi:hypothetical protein
LELEYSYRRSGLIFKGINQKARDACKAGYTLIPDADTPEGRDALLAKWREFQRRTNYERKKEQALREAYAFGDGFLEMVFPGKSYTPVAPGAVPVDVVNVDPYSLRPIRDHRPDSPTFNQTVAYWFAPHPSTTPNGTGQDIRAIPLTVVRQWVEDGMPTDKNRLPYYVLAVIHPSRIQHFQPYSVRGDPDNLGMSVIEAAYINALSKMAGDRAAGDILEWYSKGFFVVNVDYGSLEELKETRKMLDAAQKARRNYFVGSERSKFDIKSPQLVNVEPFYQQFYIEFAAALEMPLMILIGVQKGTVTGSSVDIIQYYDDVGAFQRLHVEPVQRQLLDRVLATTAYDIKWTPLYVDKQTEADLRFKGAQAAAALSGAQLLTKRQAIHYLKTGELPDEADIPDEYAEGATQVSDTPEGGDPKDGKEKPAVPK